MKKIKDNNIPNNIVKLYVFISFKIWIVATKKHINEFSNYIYPTSYYVENNY